MDVTCPRDGSAQGQDNIYPTEYLNSLNLSGLSNQCLQWKIGLSVILLRNIDLSL